MTRHRVRRTLSRTFAVLAVVLALSLACKLASHIPVLRGSPFEQLARDFYEYIRDMAPIFLTIAAAYLASVFQRRAIFVSSLERQWRDIVEAKTAILTYFDKQYPTADDWLAATGRLSAVIDTMRIVYRNAGETKDLVGLYPYAPLHDMRRVLEAAEPGLRSSIPLAERKLSKEAVAQSFYALRESFLDELDLEVPHYPVLIAGARRTKSRGEATAALQLQRRQREAMVKTASPQPEVDAYLGALYAREQQRAGSSDATPSMPETQGLGSAANVSQPANGVSVRPAPPALR